MSDQANLMLAFEYRDQFLFQAQQMPSMLEFAVTRGPSSGEKTRHELLGKVTPVERTVRHQDTPFNPTPHDDRWSVTQDFMLADLIDKFDKVRAKIRDPNMGYAKVQVAGLNRQKDSIIISAMNGVATTGQTGTGTQALPAAQKVLVATRKYDEAAGTGNSGLTYYKVLEARQILEDAFGNVNGKIHGTLFGTEKNTLIATTKTSSTHFIPEAMAPFARGEIDTLLGIQWHLMENSLVRVDGSSNRLMYIWVEEAVALDMNSDLVTRITERDDKSYSWQIFTEWMLGAVRRDDAGVVEVACHPTTLF